MKNRNIPHVIGQGTKPATKPQPQISDTKLRLPVRTEQLTLGDLLSDGKLEQLRESCSHFNQKPAELVSAVLSSWLEVAETSPEIIDEPEEYAVTVSNRGISDCGAFVFRTLITDAMSTCSPAARRRKLAGILDLMAPHAGLSNEMASLRAILEGEENLMDGSAMRTAANAEPYSLPWAS